MPIDNALAQLTVNSKYILLPGIYPYPSLLISKERKYLGKNWEETHEELKKENSFMLTPRLFVDFLKLLKSGNTNDENKNRIPDSENEFILNDILTKRNPYRGEWLDAKFMKFKREFYEKLFILYDTKSGVEPSLFGSLECCLIEEDMNFIDLNYWLSNVTSQGMPPLNCPDGNISYYSPKENRVASFWVAPYNGPCFDCDRDPKGLTVFGVRPAKIIK